MCHQHWKSKNRRALGLGCLASPAYFVIRKGTHMRRPTPKVVLYSPQAQVQVPVHTHTHTTNSPHEIFPTHINTKGPQPDQNQFMVKENVELALLVFTYLKDRSMIVIISPCFSCTGSSTVAPFTCVGFVELKLCNTAYKWRGEENTKDLLKVKFKSFQS